MYLFIIIAGVLLDWLSKRWALDALAAGSVVDIIPGFFDFQYLENRGAAFGLFQNNTAILAVISAVMALGLSVFFWKNPKLPKLAKIGLAMMIGGAIGNLIDRVVYGFVVDFIHVHLQNQWHFPTFNVADILVTLGTGLLLIYLLFLHEEA